MNASLKATRFADLAGKALFQNQQRGMFSRTLPAAMATNMKPGTPLQGLAVYKGQDPPVVEETYPDWVANLVNPDPTLAKLRKIPNEEAEDREILRFLKLKRRLNIRAQNESAAV